MRPGLDYDRTLELQTLHAILAAGRPEVVDRAVELVPPDDWYVSDHGQLLRFLEAWVRRNRPVSLTEITITLARPVDGPDRAWRGRMATELAGLEGFAAVHAVDHHLDQLAKMAARRRAWRGIEEAQSALLAADLEETEGAVTRVASTIATATTSRRADRTDYDWDQWLMDLQEDSVRGPAKRIGFGLESLDPMVAGNPGDLVLIAARPATGKTVLGLQAAVHNAMRGKRVAVASYEMPVKQLMSRLAAGHARVNARKLTDEPHRLTQYEWDALLEAREFLGSLPLFLLEAQGRTAEDLVRWVSHLGGVDLLMVDYCQLVAPMDRTASRERQVGETSTRLKQAAVQEDMVVHLLAQLSRASVGGNPRAPVLSDLRDSGQLEQDADRVLMGWIPDADSSDREWLVRKNRHGPTGEALLAFHGSRQRFGVLDEDVEV